MEREPLARVEYQAPDRFGAPATWVVDFCGRREYLPREVYADERADEVNAAASAWLDREVKKAVEAETTRCMREVVSIFGEELRPKHRAEIEAMIALRSAPGKGECRHHVPNEWNCNACSDSGDDPTRKPTGGQ